MGNQLYRWRAQPRTVLVFVSDWPSVPPWLYWPGHQEQPFPSPLPSFTLFDKNTDQDSIKDKATEDVDTARPLNLQRAEAQKHERKGNADSK